MSTPSKSNDKGKDVARGKDSTSSSIGPTSTSTGFGKLPDNS